MLHRHENWLQNLHIATADNINNSDIFLQTFPGTLIKKADKQQIEHVETFKETSENKTKYSSTDGKENAIPATVQSKTLKDNTREQDNSKDAIKKQKSKKQTATISPINNQPFPKSINFTPPGTLIENTDKQQIELVETFKETSGNEANFSGTDMQENGIPVMVQSKTSKENTREQTSAKNTIKKWKSKNQTARNSIIINTTNKYDKIYDVNTLPLKGNNGKQTMKKKFRTDKKVVKRVQKLKKNTGKSTFNKQKNLNIGKFYQSICNHTDYYDMHLKIHLETLQEKYCKGMVFNPPPEEEVFKNK